MASSSLHQLKIYQEQHPEAAQPDIDNVASLPEIQRAFARLTGWSLRYAPSAKPAHPTEFTWSAPVNPGVGTSPGHVRLDPAGPEAVSATAAFDTEGVRQLALAVSGMLEELLHTQHALWQREAELATGIPIVFHGDEQEHLADRLKSVLQAGAESIGFDAAALYLLDDSTTTLKLRASWHLPLDRFTDPPRRLQGALADLEAMLGHAVVLNDAQRLDHWNAPEDLPSAICVPVSTPTTILGTLWVFSRIQREPGERDTAMVEVVAGRIAADLEREILLKEGVDGAQLKRQLAAAERVQRNQLPSISPMLDHWELAGWTQQAQGVGGDFYDWFCLPDGLVAVTVGDITEKGIQSALSASALKAALRSHGQYHRHTDSLLQQANMTLWTGSAGDQSATLFCGLIDTTTNQFRYACAGRPSILVLRSDGWESLTQSATLLGTSPEAHYQEFEYTLQPGEVLAVFTQGISGTRNALRRPLGEAGLATSLLRQIHLPPKDLVAVTRGCLESLAAGESDHDRTALFIKRTDP